MASEYMAQRNRPLRAPTSKTCREVSDLILAYLNDQLPARTKKAFEQHIKICRDCVNFLNTYKKTVDLTRRLDPARMPKRVRENILRFLSKHTDSLGEAVLLLLVGFTA